MSDVRARYIPPAVDQVSFNCPHCGALAKQFWFGVHADKLKKDSTPLIINSEKFGKIDLDHIDDEEKQRLIKWAEKMMQTRPFIESEHQYVNWNVHNIHLSQCYSCNDIALWVYNILIWPQRNEAPLPNPDLPDDAKRDYEEASTILGLSPRGAAALLRLSIQKICTHLGEQGKNIDADIASLVKKGLDIQVQQALDIVRVIGNNAVHPGQIDLRDDRAIAENLFGLINLISEIMISRPKHIQEMFSRLPETYRRAIEKRDSK